MRLVSRHKASARQRRREQSARYFALSLLSLRFANENWYIQAVMAKHHLIISGTGRTGTTFLIQLFTQK
jgi:hypothetical protein